MNKPKWISYKAHIESLIHSARVVVREIGYVVQWADQTAVGARGYEYSRIMHAYDMACAHLIKLDPHSAAEFIRSTYGPSFRQTQKAG